MAPLLSVTRQQDGEPSDTTRLLVVGELDSSTCEQLAEAIDEAFTSGSRSILLDLAKVEFIDSMGLRTIVQARNRLAEHSATVEVDGMSGAAQRLLEITGLIDHLRRGAGQTSAEPPSSG